MLIATDSIEGIRDWSNVFIFVFLSAFVFICFPVTNHTPKIFFSCLFGSIRFCFAIWAPPVGVLIYRALASNSEAQELVFYFEKVAECMDENVVLNTEQVRD